MPLGGGSFGNIFRDIEQQRQLRDSILSRQAELQERLQQRDTQQQALDLYRQQLMALRQQQFGLQQQKFSLKNAQDRALSQWVMQMDPNTIEPQWRNYLTYTQKMLASDPLGGIEAARAFATKYRPAGLQFKSVQTVDPSTGLPTEDLFVFDPMNPRLPSGLTSGAPSPGPSAAGGGGGASPPVTPSAPTVRPPPPAPTTGTTLDPSGLGLLHKYKTSGP